MVKLADPDSCCGCTACEFVCPAAAVKMVADGGGFAVPKVDAAKCRDCGACARACPVLRPDASRIPLAAFALRARRRRMRLRSSSGGVFTLLAEETLRRGGIVFGAAWDRDRWRVVHRRVEDRRGLGELRGSKYVQSDFQGILSVVKKEVDEGRPVLFSGVPCQVSAVRRALNAPVENLITVDVICHGAPSPAAWDAYLTEKSALGDPADISFRDKTDGWRNYSMKIRFADGACYRASHRVDSYMQGFLQNLYLRPSCHNCQSRELRSGSDLTLADCWGVTSIAPALHDDTGTSVALANTSAGRALLEKVLPKCDFMPVDPSLIIQNNRTLATDHPVHPGRAEFFSRFREEGFERTVRDLLNLPGCDADSFQQKRRWLANAWNRLRERLGGFRAEPTEVRR